MARILGDGKRQRTRVFSELRSHYLFEDRFGRPGKGNDKGSRGSSAIAVGTSYCRCQGSGTSMISARILKPAAPSDGRNNCMATTRRSANAWNGIVRFFSAVPQSPTTPATSARGGSVRCRWCAIAAPITPSPHGSAIARCGPRLCQIRGGHQLRRKVIARHPRSYEQEDFVFIRCTICPCWSKRPTRWIGGSLGRLAVAAGVRRSPTAYLKRGWAKPGSGNTGAAANRELLPRRFEAISEALERGVIGFDAVKLPGAVPDREAAATLEPAGPSLSARAEVATTSARSYMGLLKGAAP